MRSLLVSLPPADSSYREAYEQGMHKYLRSVSQADTSHDYLVPQLLEKVLLRGFPGGPHPVDEACIQD